MTFNERKEEIPWTGDTRPVSSFSLTTLSCLWFKILLLHGSTQTSVDLVNIPSISSPEVLLALCRIYWPVLLTLLFFANLCSFWVAKHLSGNSTKLLGIMLHFCTEAYKTRLGQWEVWSCLRFLIMKLNLFQSDVVSTESLIICVI